MPYSADESRALALVINDHDEWAAEIRDTRDYTKLSSPIQQECELAFRSFYGKALNHDLPPQDQKSINLNPARHNRPGDHPSGGAGKASSAEGVAEGHMQGGFLAKGSE